MWKSKSRLLLLKETEMTKTIKFSSKRTKKKPIFSAQKEFYPSNHLGYWEGCEPIAAQLEEERKWWRHKK